MANQFYLSIDKIIKDLSKKHWATAPRTYTVLKELEAAIESYLIAHPYDLTTKVRLALAVYERPLANDLKAMECLEEVIAAKPDYIEAYLILAYIRHHCIPMDQPFIKKLENALHFTENAEERGMLYLMIAWGYEREDPAKYFPALHKSVQNAPHLVRNNHELGCFYLRTKEQHSLAMHYLGTAIKNVQKISNTLYDEDITSIEDFINELIKGTVLGETGYAILAGYLDSDSDIMKFLKKWGVFPD